MVDFRKELPFLFREFGPSSRVNCVARPQNGGFIPIAYSVAALLGVESVDPQNLPERAPQNASPRRRRRRRRRQPEQ